MGAILGGKGGDVVVRCCWENARRSPDELHSLDRMLICLSLLLRWTSSPGLFYLFFCFAFFLVVMGVGEGGERRRQTRKNWQKCTHWRSCFNGAPSGRRSQIIEEGFYCWSAQGPTQGPGGSRQSALAGETPSEDSLSLSLSFAMTSRKFPCLSHEQFS